MVKVKHFLFLLLATCSVFGTGYSDITWTTPVAISTAATNASDPHVVIDSSNNATAVWVENNVIQASSLPSGGSWSTPVSLSNVLNTSSNPKLAIDSSGNVTAIWIENTQIESATLPFGGSWTVETSPISGSGASNAVLAMDNSGNAVAVWVRSSFIESSTRISGSWSLVSVLSSASSSNPHVAISSFGKAIAVWHGVASGADVIVSDILTIATNTWGLSKNVFSGTAAMLHNYPKVAIDVNGNANVAWIRYNLLDGNAYENVQILVSSLTQGASSWSLGQILSNAGIRNPADLTIKLRYDLNGNAIVVWTNSYDGDNFTIESSQRLFGQPSWQNFITAENPNLYSFGIDVANVSGTALLTNMAWDGSSTLYISSQESDTAEPVVSSWTGSNPFSTGSSNGYPQCAISTSGGNLNAVAVWIHFDGSNRVIHASSGSDAVIAPPSSVSATQSSTDLGVYTDYYNTITWSASSDPNIIQYNIFRDGVYFTATDPGTFQFVDHNQVQNGTVTYGVAALNSAFRQSDTITYTLFP